MDGKVVVLTGGTSGIGQVAATELARQGARIILIARDRNRARQALADVSGAGPGVAHRVVYADLASIGETRRVAAEIAAAEPRIDVLVNNAGALFNRRRLSPDGLEMTFAVNHMAYFVITEVLRPNLGPRARIVSTASGAHSFARLDFDDLQSRKRYSAMTAYGNSKLCNIMWTGELSRRLASTGVTANCFHPGAVNTAFGHNTKGLLSAAMLLAQRFMLTPEQGADTLVWLASAREVEGRTGGYWTKRKLTQPSAAARDPANVARLWAESAKIAGWPQLATA